ncbi:ubiquitin carboxyl-terminal hydrolase 7 [Planococcus citri]|uniref:ubiquitin carboxyl-terminal hydrolase 7 n=1 Tax=Planococcus citri TaxID=170843 RepID=UPI0031F87726
MSGKNIYPSLDQLKNKKKNILEEQPYNEMNHITNVDSNNDIEEMDTQDVEPPESGEDILSQFNDNMLSNTSMNGELQDDAVTPMESDMPEDDARSKATFDFVVENFSRIKDAVLSQPCMIRNLPWKIMVMQRPGNTADRSSSKSLGFFLQCNGESESSSWSCFANAQLIILSQKEGVEEFSRKIQHLFYSKENDWGFSHFMSWNDVMNPERGYIKDDTIILRAVVTADAPHGVSWDSKKHTGYVGLKNQGATCYMNSLLQTLYFTNQLRKAVYKMPTESDDSSKSVALALQRVFYDLQFSDKPVGTKRLTKSFGWEALDSFMQHDVQEFLRVLLDKLENKMKGTCVEGTVPKLFEGKMESFIKCKNVNYESKRSETFYDIQLNVKGKKNIDESFRDYVTTEILEGDNKYDAGEYGLQDAEKGVIFESFPPVLHLHLMRFQYDPITDCCVKFNDRFEFYEKISLNQYLQCAGNTPANYTLHAVLVHSGDNHGGHYVVFINPKGDGKWCKFDDDVVSRCSKQEAIEYNYGGQDEELTMTVKHCTNAYMLVYIRDSELKNVLQEVTNDDIPAELEARLQEERRIEQFRRKERNESHLYTTMNVFLEDCFDGHQGPDLFDQEQTQVRVFKVKKTNTVDQIVETLSQSFNCPMEQLRIWPFAVRPNQTYRPIHFDIISEMSKQIGDITDNHPWSIFLEIIPLDIGMNMLPTFDSESEVLVFFKLYDPKVRKIYYCGHHYVQSGSTFNDLVPILNERAGYSPNTRLLLYEEVRAHVVQEINTYNEPLEKVLEELADGDIFVFQKDDASTADLPNCKEHFRDLMNRVEIAFCDKNIPNDTGFILELSLNTKYEKMVEAVAERVGIDKHRIQIFKCQSGSVKEIYGHPIAYAFDGVVKDLVSITPNKKTVKKLFYQTLAMPLHELENKKPFKVLWIGPKLKEEKEITLYPNKNGTVADLLEEAKNVVDLAADGSGKLRILELSSSRLTQGPDEHTPLEALPVQKSYRIEEIPKDEVNLANDEMLIPVAHFQKDVYTTFGTPFLLKIKDKEPFSEVRERIFQKLGVTEKEFEKYKFALVITGRPRFLSDNMDTVINFQEFRSNTSVSLLHKPWLGLEHTNKAPKRSRYNYLEKAIKIYN